MPFAAGVQRGGRVRVGERGRRCAGRPPTGSDAGLDCLAAWQTGAPTLSAPVELAELDTPGNESDPWLTADELTIFFAHAGDIYVAQRAAITDAFGSAVAVSSLDSPKDDARVTLSADGMVAVLSSSRTGAESHDLFQAARGGSDITNWSDPLSDLFEHVNTSAGEYDPDLSGDGLTLRFSVSTGSGSMHHLATASRTSETGAFAAPSTIAIDGGSGLFADPTESADGSVLVFTQAPDDDTATDLALGLRVSPTEFTLAGALSVDTAANEGDGALSVDACRLYFSSDRSGGTGGRDLYVTSVVAP